MEDVKWLLKKCGLPILILLFAVIAGVICWGKLHTEERKSGGRSMGATCRNGKQ